MTTPKDQWKEIPLTQGKVAIVDSDDFERLSKYNWFARKDGRLNRDFRAMRTKNYHTISMARVIMNAPEGMLVDHINHDTLDNRKQNLRICTKGDNNRNNIIRKDNKSGYKGVSWNKKDRVWRAQIAVNGVQTYIGSFGTAEKAAEAYNKKAKELFGEFCVLNNIKTI